MPVRNTRRTAAKRTTKRTTTRTRSTPVESAVEVGIDLNTKEVHEGLRNVSDHLAYVQREAKATSDILKEIIELQRPAGPLTAKTHQEAAAREPNLRERIADAYERVIKVGEHAQSIEKSFITTTEELFNRMMALERFTGIND